MNFLSKISGLIRELILAGFLGTRVAADAFKAALQIPGLLQNILGEGTLSASFVPTYSRLVDNHETEKESGIVAGTVATFLGLITSIIVLVEYWLLDPSQRYYFLCYLMKLSISRLIWLESCGLGWFYRPFILVFGSPKRPQKVLSFAAPILWNAAQIIFSLIAWGKDWSEASIATAAAWGVLVGGALQFLIQIPLVLKVAPSLKLGLQRGLTAVKEIISKFFPAVLGRGVVQFSGFLDLFLAGFLATGAFTALSLAQIIYMLPIGLFVMSIISADLPEFSRDQGIPLRLGKDFLLARSESPST